MMHHNRGRSRIHHHFRCPSCETVTLSVSVDYVHSGEFWSVKVSALSSSPLNQVSLGVGWRC